MGLFLSNGLSSCTNYLHTAIAVRARLAGAMRPLHLLEIVRSGPDGNGPLQQLKPGVTLIRLQLRKSILDGKRPFSPTLV